VGARIACMAAWVETWSCEPQGSRSRPRHRAPNPPRPPERRGKASGAGPRLRCLGAAGQPSAAPPPPQKTRQGPQAPQSAVKASGGGGDPRLRYLGVAGQGVGVLEDGGAAGPHLGGWGGEVGVGEVQEKLGDRGRLTIREAPPARAAAAGAGDAAARRPGPAPGRPGPAAPPLCRGGARLEHGPPLAEARPLLVVALAALPQAVQALRGRK
jgi:hypothetical protein